MNNVILLVGSSQGDKTNNLKMSQQELSKCCKITKFSSIFESEAWGFESADTFFNQVLILETTFSPQQFLEEIHRIENKLGRVREEKQWISRLIDIDILFFNDEVMETKELTIPHKQIEFRRFTLEPLVEIIPHYIHPILKKEIKELLDLCQDKGKVWRIV